MTEARQRLGKKGEEAACAYLERKGYVICRRNYRCRYGEIDIIAAKGGELSFVGVRRFFICSRKTGISKCSVLM